MAGRASAIRSAPSSPTSSPAVRYWNRARQRYHRLSARYSRACVSLPTQAARPGPDNRGKPRLLDLERRIPARDRFAPDSPLEGDGFELLVPRQSPAWTSGSPFISRRYLQARTPPPDADEAVCDHSGLRVRERRLAAHDALEGLASRTPREPARDTAVRSLLSRPFPAA